MVLLDLLVLQDPLDPLDLVVDSALLNFKLSSNLDLKDLLLLLLLRLTTHTRFLSPCAMIHP